MSQVSGFIFAAVLMGTLSLPLSFVHAQDSHLGHQIAQASGVDDSYDPFADFNEYQQQTEEEADIHFFRNGRFFAIGMLLGTRTFTGNMAEIYDSTVGYGMFMTYFFDLRTALQVSYNTGDHTYKILGPGGTTEQGTSSLSDWNLSLKYFLNTGNVTKGLADLNPYLIGGFAFVNRRTYSSMSEFPAESKSTGVAGGAGIEIPLMRNKMFLGVQATYQMLNFADENSSIFIGDPAVDTGLVPSGDAYNLMATIGINF